MDDDLEIHETDAARARLLKRASVGAGVVLWTFGLSVLGVATIAIGIVGAFQH
jgi:hypothetical protein